MQVKIGTKIYDANKEPILLILTAKDKQDIVDMLPEATQYCQYPDEGYTYEEILKWIEGSDGE